MINLDESTDGLVAQVRRRGDGQDRFAIVVILVGVTCQAYLARGLWFFSDTWAYLLRDASTFAGLLEPNQGHLALVTILALNAMYELVGLDYFPWFHLLRSVSYAALALSIWSYMRYRSVGPYMRWTILLIVLSLSQQSWLMAYTFANPMIHAILLASLITVDKNPRPTPLTGLTVMTGLLIAVASGGTAIAGTAGLLAVAISQRRWRWLGPLVVPILAYTTWFILYVARSEASGSSAGTLGSLPTELPKIVLEVLSGAIGRTLSLPPDYWPLFGSLVLVALIWAGMRGEFSSTDSYAVLAIIAFLSMLGVARAGTGLASLTEVRYTFNVSIWLIVLIVPTMTRLVFRRQFLVIVPLIAVVLVGNVSQLLSSMDDWERTLSYGREITETAGALMAAGERFDPNAPIDGDRTAVLIASDVRNFLQEGWVPRASQDERLRARARAELKLAWSTREPWRGFAPDNADELVGQGCEIVAARDVLQTHIEDARTLVVKQAEDTVVEIRWEDNEGPALRRVDAFRGTSFVRMIDPLGGPALLEVSVTSGDSVEICNLPGIS